jgi:hypothetical protein
LQTNNIYFFNLNNNFKKMKKIKAFLIATGVSVALATGISSCVTDKCKDVVCQNDGICIEGTCDCPTGYEGTFCDTKANAKFVGTWSTNETCGGSTGTPYSVTIAASTDPTIISMENLGNYSCTSGSYSVPGTISGSTITVNSTVTACSTLFTGTGTLNAAGNSIALTYAATYGSPSTTDNCSATLTK